MDFPTPKTTNSQVTKAQERLRESVSKLEATRQKYTTVFKDIPTIQDDFLRLAVDDASNETNTGEAFGKVLGAVMANHNEYNKSVAGKVGDFMGKLYPVAQVALGIVSFSADVSARIRQLCTGLFLMWEL